MAGVTARSEFSLALNQVCSEREIEPEVVLESIAAAVLSAFRKELSTSEGKTVELEDYEVKVDPETGETKIFDKKGNEVTPAGFGRIAAQTAKQVILQKIREAEKEAVMGEFTDKVGSVVSGMVLRFDGPNIVVDIGRATGIMPPSEQVYSERYRLNQRLAFYIKEIRESIIIVSRTDPGLVKGLFAREVPEAGSGAVEIKIVAREAGSRSKVAVASSQSGVDPVGSCVGQKGVRVSAVIAELGGLEKIDIIQWYEETEKFVASALSPAKDVEVKTDEKNKMVTAVVADDQLSLAIGKDGQNVRLASKLTGYRIDIRGQSDKAKEMLGVEDKNKELKEASDKSKKEAKEEKGELERLGIGKRYVTVLEKAGVKKIKKLKEMVKSGKLKKVKGMGEKGIEEVTVKLEETTGKKISI